jgi:hypothetical protein
MKPVLYCFAILSILLLGFPTRAEAYLDPSTGSMVLQIIAGSILAAAATMKIYWSRIRSTLRRDRKL